MRTMTYAMPPRNAEPFPPSQVMYRLSPALSSSPFAVYRTGYDRVSSTGRTITWSTPYTPSATRTAIPITPRTSARAADSYLPMNTRVKLVRSQRAQVGTHGCLRKTVC